MDSAKYTKVILSEAEDEIDKILDYIVNDLKNPTAAKKLWCDMLMAMERIEAFPYAMPKLQGEFVPIGTEYRRIDVGIFVLIYKIVDELKEIRIVAAAYASSDLEMKLLKRL